MLKNLRQTIFSECWKWTSVLRIQTLWMSVSRRIQFLKFSGFIFSTVIKLILASSKVGHEESLVLFQFFTQLFLAVFFKFSQFILTTVIKLILASLKVGHEEAGRRDMKREPMQHQAPGLLYNAIQCTTLQYNILQTIYSNTRRGTISMYSKL